MTTNQIAFLKDLQSWNNIASSFSDIYVEASMFDLFEWRVTISKFSNDSEYKFHFMVFWHNGWFRTQPKISLLLGQSCMVNCSNLYGNWLLLDKNITAFSVTSVLISLRNIVRRIDVSSINVNEFNSHSNMNTPQKEINIKDSKLVLEDNDIDNNSNIIENDNNSNLSVSNSSMVSLTISNCTNVSVDTSIDTTADINLETKIPTKNNHVAEISTESIVEISNNKKINTSQPKLISKIKITINKKDVSKPAPKVKLNKKKKDTEKDVVRYLEIDENGCLVWTEGRIPNEKNQSITLNNSSKSTFCGWKKKI